MLKSIFILLVVGIVGSTALPDIFYYLNPRCRPSTVEEGISCDSLGTSITIKGGLVSPLILYNHMFK